MSTTNYGNQTINWKYKTPLKGSNLSKMFNGWASPGIYLNNGVLVTPGTGLVAAYAANQIIISPFTAVFKASSTQTVHIYTSSLINISADVGLGSITSSAPYITMSYTWADQIINYIDFSFKAIGNITQYDLVIGKAVFTGASVTSIDYSVATYPPTYNQSTQTFNINNDLLVNNDVIINSDLTILGNFRPTNIIIISDGWTLVESTCTYASSTTFTMVGDKTNIFSVGDRFKLTQTTIKYFALFSISYSSGTGLTTFTVIGDPSNTLVNATITNVYYSKKDNPNGYPNTFLYTPTLTGWSSNPSGIYKWSLSGNLLTLYIRQYTAGTSNSGACDFTVPYPAKTITNMMWIGPAWGYDNGTYSAKHLLVRILSAGTTFSAIFSDVSPWTSSGGKYLAGATLTYEI